MSLNVCKADELTFFPGKQVYRLTNHETTTTKTADGFSDRGGIYVLANILHNVVHSNIIEGRNQLCSRSTENFQGANLSQEERKDFSTPANAFFISAIFGLGSFLDSFAALCNTIFPDEKHRDKVNFMQFGFETGEVPSLHRKKLQLLSYKFSGKHIVEIWNQCKHERPWLGLVSISDGDGYADVKDDQNKGIFLDFIMPVYTIAQEMLSDLAKHHHLTVKKLSL